MRALAAKPLARRELDALDAYWRAANYLAAAQIYLRDNPLLRRPLEPGDVKPRLLGHWGTSPGLNLLYVHLNRVIRKRDLDVLFIAGPGHGAPAVVANSYLEGVYSETYPAVSEDEAGLKKLFAQFSAPGGIPSHASPETPGSIHEGGELGYSLAHAYGAVFDNPGLLAACVVGDGEAETGPLAGSWHSNKFLNPARDGAVLPILHLNGYKIAGPSFLARVPSVELAALLRGYGHEPIVVAGSDPAAVHQKLAAALDYAVAEIARLQAAARAGKKERPRWPMIVLRTPKGWTGPKTVDGKKVEGTFRAHQLPLAKLDNPEHLRLLEAWLKSYRPEELFDARGRLLPALRALAPKGKRRMSANPRADGGRLLKDLRMPDFRDYALPVPAPGAVEGEATRVQGRFLRDVLKANRANFRIFSPDETVSNRWDAVLEADARCLQAEILPDDERVSREGRVMEVLSEHLCQGWLEGYLLTGRHGFFGCYEAFIHVVDSMFNQHAKWLKVSRGVPWRRPIASLNYLLSSHVWRQDHNGFSHQDPGFLDHVVNKKSAVIRVYLPPDANTLLSVTDHCLRSRHYVNVVVAGKQPAPQWLDMDAAARHCAAGLGVWEWASVDGGRDPEAVLACCGDVPTLEALAAADLLRRAAPGLRLRVVNVVNLMKLQPLSEHPHGLSDEEFAGFFPPGVPVIFAFHGYPWLIHRLTYARPGQSRIRAHGYREEGTTTTPFDMTVLNELDRFHLAMAVLDAVPRLAAAAEGLKRPLRDKLLEHRRYIVSHGEDMPEILAWKWPATRGE